MIALAETYQSPPPRLRTAPRSTERTGFPSRLRSSYRFSAYIRPLFFSRCLFLKMQSDGTSARITAALHAVGDVRVLLSSFSLSLPPSLPLFPSSNSRSVVFLAIRGRLAEREYPQRPSRGSLTASWSPSATKLWYAFLFPTSYRLYLHYDIYASTRRHGAPVILYSEAICKEYFTNR